MAHACDQLPLPQPRPNPLLFDSSMITTHAPDPSENTHPVMVFIVRSLIGLHPQHTLKAWLDNAKFTSARPATQPTIAGWENAPTATSGTHSNNPSQTSRPLRGPLTIKPAHPSPHPKLSRSHKSVVKNPSLASPPTSTNSTASSEATNPQALASSQALLCSSEAPPASAKAHSRSRSAPHSLQTTHACSMSQVKNPPLKSAPAHKDSISPLQPLTPCTSSPTPTSRASFSKPRTSDPLS